MASRACLRGAFTTGPSSLIGDEKRMDRASIKSLVQLQCPIDESLHGGLVGDQLRTVLGNRDSGSPGGCSPVQQRRLSRGKSQDGGFGFRVQSLAKAAISDLQAA